MIEFPVGRCECGSVYVCDATGHNLGAAMVECLVFACGDDWDLAWELMPEEDYLTGRVENYDDQTHQVIPTGNLDGRYIRGVLYFVRLHKDIAEIADRVKEKKESEENRLTDKLHVSLNIPNIEPERDPRRKKKRASKQLVRELVCKGDINQLVDLSFDDKKTLRFLQRLLYEPDETERYKTAWILGQVCSRLSTREPGPVADLLHRLFEACSDSASTSWGMIEAIGSIIAARPDIYGAFTRYLLNYLGDESTREHVLWALCEIASIRSDLVRKIPFYVTFQFLNHPDPKTRGLTARMLGRIKAREASFQIMGLQNDLSEILIYEHGVPVPTTVAEQAGLAVQYIHNNPNGVQESE